MKVDYAWLREYCAPELALEELAALLTLTGTKVDAVHEGAGAAPDGPGGVVVEFDITPNRPDCLGVYGIAREVHAATGAPLAPPPWEPDPGEPGPLDGLDVVVEASELCPRFTARVFDGLTVGPSPPWLQRRLLACGHKPVNNVVDITNYVMLATGHPLHAFDLDRVVGGRLVVRRARASEIVVTLDGKDRRLRDGMAVIADEEGTTSIAGIMGCARSEIRDDTTTVVVEAAAWHGASIMRTSNALGLRTEASGRFEKGLAPEQAIEAQAMATRLLVELAGARPRRGTIDVGDEPSTSRVVRLREARVQGLLGHAVARDLQQRTLEALGFDVADAYDGLDVTIPPFRRSDVTREADLVEEVGRFTLGELPATLPRDRPAARLAPEQLRHRRVVDLLVGRGFYEVLGWSLTEPSVADRLRLEADDPRRGFVVVQNPMSDRHSVLRTVLLGSLLDVAQTNVRKGQRDLLLFESGTVYQHAQGRSLPHEHQALCVLVHGALSPPSWGVTPSPVALPAAEAYAVKGVLEAIAGTFRITLRVEQDGAADPFLHPARGGRILTEHGEEIGYIGELHPLVSGAWGLDRAGCFELDLDRLIALAHPKPANWENVSSAVIRQDVSVVVSEELSASRVLEIARRRAAEAEIFDVFSDGQLGAGRKSLTLRCVFRDESEPLVEARAAMGRDLIIQDLAEVGGKLRG